MSASRVIYFEQFPAHSLTHF